MKDIIYVTLGEDHVFQSETKTIARSDENNITQLAITLDETLINYWVYLDFIKPDGTKYKTSKLDVVGNVVTYDIPNSLLSESGILKVQAVLQNEEGDVWKSTIHSYGIDKSIDATDDIPNKEDFITEAQKLLEEVYGGLTPTIGENENWFILEKDTGKPSRGPKGDAYVITDEDKEEIELNIKTDIQPTLENIQEVADAAESIAKGANQALSFGDYSTMINVFNVLPNDTYRTGQNILIVTLNVPDLWISEVLEESITYTYTTDEDFANLLKEQGYLQVGYYKLSALETQKVDLTNYPTFTDYATLTKAGVVKAGQNGVYIDGTGALYIGSATNNEIDKRIGNYKPIVPTNLDYAVKSVVGGHITLTQAEYDALETKDENTYYYILEEE